jgi:tetratricopeptide (TPR) repeat protein
MAAQGARAAGKDSKERAAKTACLSGDAAKGVALLAELYVDTNDITYLFNQGRCFEQNGRYADAIIRFREYLGKNKDAGKATDPVAERHLADCQALLDKQAPQPAAPTPTPSTAATIQPAAPAAETVAAPARTETSATAAPTAAPHTDITQAMPANTSPGAGLRIAGIAAMAVGVAGIATGVILNLKANTLASELEKSNTSYSRSKEATRSNYQTFGWVGYGAGAACVVGGALLFYLGHSQGQNAQVALLPTLQPGQLGAALQGDF